VDNLAWILLSQPGELLSGPRSDIAPFAPPSTALQPMLSSRSELFARLAELGISTRTVEHPPVFTVAESSMLERDIPGGTPKTCSSKMPRAVFSW
jgi:hypothetical protein